MKLAYVITYIIMLPALALADTPTATTVKARAYSGDGNTAVTTTGSALNVNVTNSSSLSTVTQGAAGVSSWLAAITSSALPANACQETGGHLASIDSKLTSPLAVTGAFYPATQPVSGTLTCNAGTGTQAVSLAALPPLVAGSATIGAVNVNGTVPVSGSVSVTNLPATQAVSAVSLPLPTGAATAAKQAAPGIAGTPSSDVITVQGATSMTPLKVDGSGVTQPVSGTVAISNPSTTMVVTQSTGTNLHTVVDSGAVTATISGTPSVSVSNFPSSQAVTGSFYQATQPVSAASLPLPSGAATSAAQTTAQTSLTSIDTKTPALGQALAAASAPVVLPAAQVTALTPPTTVAVTQATGTNLHAVIDSGAVTATVSGSVSVSNFPATQAVSAASLPLPAGAATAAKQPALGTAGTASADVLTVQGAASMTALKVDGSAVTQPVSGTVAVSNQPTTLAVTQATGTNLHTVVDSGAVTATISGTPNVAVTSSALPTGAATSANQSTEITSLGTIATNSGTQATAANQSTGNTSLATIATNTTGASTAANQATEISSLATIVSNTSRVPALGQTTMANSQPVAIASDQSTLNVLEPDLYVTGASAQTALVNNILTVASGTAATDLTGYKSASVQVVSTGTAGGLIFEGSNDNVNFQTIPVYSQLILTGTPIVAAITPTASQLVYTFPVNARYIRLRISTAVTGGSVQAFSKFSQAPYSPAVMQMAQATAANLNATVTGTVNVGTLTSVTSDNLAIPGIVADVASAALTTTTTTATLTPTNGVGYIVDIPVTVVSGTTPTLSVAVQESQDTGTNWVTVYTFPTITATGSYVSPPLYFRGNRVRYVQTVTGTTPSFTRAINRLQMSAIAAAPVNNNATFATGSVTVATTLTAPTNAIGFVLQNLNTNTTGLRYAIGATASATNGMQLEPGRDTGEIHAGQNISICPESGTISYSIQWVQQ